MNELERFSAENAHALTAQERARIGVTRFWFGLLFGIGGTMSTLVVAAVLSNLLRGLVGWGAMDALYWAILIGTGVAVARLSRPLRTGVYRWLVRRAERRLHARLTLHGVGGSATSTGVGPHE